MSFQLKNRRFTKSSTKKKLFNSKNHGLPGKEDNDILQKTV